MRRSMGIRTASRQSGGFSEVFSGGDGTRIWLGIICEFILAALWNILLKAASVRPDEGAGEDRPAIALS
jgi:hypothetical protein